MDTPRAVLLILILLFLFLSPDPQQPSPTQGHELDDLIVEERRRLDLLNRTRYGDFDAPNNRWLNITGLREEDGFAWQLLPTIKERAREQLKGAVGERGLRELEGNIEELPPAAEPEAGLPEALKHSVIPLYQNLTGFLHGEWVRSKAVPQIPVPHINLTESVPHLFFASETFERNVTGPNGDIQIDLDEKVSRTLKGDDAGLVREVTAQMTIKDDVSGGDGWMARLHGVHYPTFGAVVLTTTSERFAGLFALPHFSLSERTYSLSQRLLNRTISSSINSQVSKGWLAPLNPWSSTPGHPADIPSKPRCEYIVYLQQHAADFSDKDGGNQQVLRQIEDELRYPTGASLPSAPPLVMSALIFSPDCGILLESKSQPETSAAESLHITGPKIESYISQARNYSLLFACIMIMQIILLMRQMKDASTPSTRSRISFYTIAMMSMGDGFATMAFSAIGLFTDSVFLPFIATSFLSLFCVSFFGMKFLMEIWTVQAPERQERERERQAAAQAANSTTNTTATSMPIITASGADTLPLPVTARRPNETSATPIIIAPDQDSPPDTPTPSPAPNNPTTTNTTTPAQTPGSARREFGALYSRFYFLLLILIFLSLHAMSWPPGLRSAYTNGLALTYLSFWVPQIYRNIMRNCRKALRWEYVVGQSILRLAPFMYFYTVPGNVLFAKTDRTAALVLIGWVWIQICVLVSQEVLGPRFFVPRGWAPEAYDYHPVLREDDLESGATMPIGFSAAEAEAEAGSPSSPSAAVPGSSSGRQGGKRTFDCAICMNNIEVPIIPAGSGAEGGGRDESGGGGITGGGTTSTLLARRAYMVTPCRHIFHSDCLEGWMRFRLQCPICRETLPPL
ncbi:hypothetical protein L228DRAFT_243262 [Xylona heveae TC161]|uniref:DSC E3 ubiquitin ligase complex subunit A n=1 Tax=Xylona heveae (strain CBS 132557 / TC161) TaxID=1328760 RepID=A0A165JXJ1_XYLHT|nr:hypothetical protein L228DRAFT_243262 [Xylona heveae TC161]KZF26750.1 hypothetical protein L228DRAFT_243262 [Xylona heveae TC161]